MKKQILSQLNQSLTPKNETREKLEPREQGLGIVNEFQHLVHDAHAHCKRDSFLSDSKVFRVFQGDLRAN
jgi:hypothetical protein